MVVVVLVPGESGLAREVGAAERKRDHLLQEARRSERRAGGEEVGERREAPRRGRVHLRRARNLWGGDRAPQGEAEGGTPHRAPPRRPHEDTQPGETEGHERDHRLSGQDLQPGDQGQLGNGTALARRGSGGPAAQARRGRHDPRCQGEGEAAVEETPGGDINAGERKRDRGHLRRAPRRPFRPRPPPCAGIGEHGGQREAQPEGGGQGQQQEGEHVGKERPEVRVAGQRLSEGGIRIEEREHALAHLLDGGGLGRQVRHDRVLVRHHAAAGDERHQWGQQQRAQYPDPRRRHWAGGAAGPPGVTAASAASSRR
jgi:hypothetical protein